jgi:RimJ/RimL family protein N-acetyltransferase
MRVRAVASEDLAELGRGFKLVVDEKRWLGVQPPVTDEGMAAWLRERIGDGRQMLALEDDGGALVGMIDIHATRTAGVQAIGMWVLAGQRGRGGGRMLLEAAIAARPPDTHKIELEVWPHNEAAIGLYERLGFEREGLRRDHYRRRDGHLASSLIMARLFPDATAPDPS